MKANKRDISLIDLSKNKYMVIACDSAGGIGEKENDYLQVPGEVVGRFTVRVPLMEILAVGARIISVVDTLSVEYEPSGRRIIEGIKQEVEITGLNSELMINGSTEENMETYQTGVGVTVVGLVDKKSLRLGISRKKDLVIAIGYPMVGQDVLENKGSIADLNDLTELLQLDYVHEILPVGSKGIRYEVNVLAEASGFTCQLDSGLDLDMDKSAGPATVLLLTIPREYYFQLQKGISKPLTIIGKLL